VGDLGLLVGVLVDLSTSTSMRTNFRSLFHTNVSKRLRYALWPL